MTTFVPTLSAAMHGIAQVISLGMMISGGIAIYGLLLVVFGVIAWADAVSAVRKREPFDLRD